MPPESDVVRVRHMVDAGREAMGFCQGRSRADLDTDRMFARALVKAIEIIGEATSKVSQQTRLELPDMPWADIVTMRHRLTHSYFDIDLDIVWNTAAFDVPPLVVTLDRWLPGK